MRLFLVFILLLLCFCFKGDFSYAQVEYVASDMRDPFENQLPIPEPEPEPGVVPQQDPAEVPEASVTPPEIIVDGIISGGPVPQAVIQHKVVRVGDTISGARISKITKEGIEVVYEGASFVFPAPSRAVKTGQGGKNVLQ